MSTTGRCTPSPLHNTSIYLYHVLSKGYLMSGPMPFPGVPHWNWMEYPSSRLNGIPHQDLLSGLDGCTPLSCQDLMGVRPPYQDLMGLPPLGLDGGTPPPSGLEGGMPIRTRWCDQSGRQSSRTITCYEALCGLLNLPNLLKPKHFSGN